MDLLSDVLALLKLQGTLYFRTEFSPPWGLAVPQFENVARFHFVHRGRCWLLVAGADKPLLLEQGDLAIVPRGNAASISLCCGTATRPTAFPVSISTTCPWRKCGSN